MSRAQPRGRRLPRPAAMRGGLAEPGVNGPVQRKAPAQSPAPRPSPALPPAEREGAEPHAGAGSPRSSLDPFLADRPAPTYLPSRCTRRSARSLRRSTLSCRPDQGRSRRLHSASSRGGTHRPQAARPSVPHLTCGAAHNWAFSGFIR